MDLPAFMEAVEIPEFYFGSSEYAELADVIIVAQEEDSAEVELPAHSAVLAQHSRVLRSLFVAMGEAGGATEPAGRTVLREPFYAYSSYDVSTLLRLVYSPRDANEANFSALECPLLETLLVLAHSLDMPSLLASLASHVTEHVAAYSLAETVGLVNVAEKCVLEGTRTACVRHLADRLAAPDTSITNLPAWHDTLLDEALADASILKELSQEAVQAVVGACVAGMRRAQIHHPSCIEIPPHDSMEAALKRLEQRQQQQEKEQGEGEGAESEASPVIASLD